MTLQPPNNEVKRPYHSPRREAQATETRRLILEAALSLFETGGFRGTTVKQVAERASVSEQTVYNVFGDKTGLLYEVGIYAMSSGDGGTGAEFFEALSAEPDPMKRIRLAARFGREQWQEGAVELDLMLFSPDIKDPRLVDLAQQVLAFKFEINRAMFEILFPDSIRRPGVSVDQIATFAAAVDSGYSITTLMKLGWTMDQYEAWIVQLLSLFLDPAVLGTTLRDDKSVDDAVGDT